MTNRKSVCGYISRLEEEVEAHKLQERLDKVTALRAEYPSDEHVQQALDRIDVQTWELQKYCESKCRHIYKKECDYSGPVVEWNKRLRCYNDLLWRYSKGVRNMSNIVKRCLQAGIANPKQLTQQQCSDGATYC